MHCYHRVIVLKITIKINDDLNIGTDDAVLADDTVEALVTPAVVR